ncbi:MAG: hypothetical protein IID43_01660 [Planctomycetes bacterium]|nr:hypothetical protein [Planctomycetota bacterium]
MNRGGEFVDEILAKLGPIKAFEPCACYDPDGDGIEFQLSNEPFRGERLDRWVTVYRSEKTDDIVGGLVKDVGKLTREFPGLDIEIHDGRVDVACILLAPAWKPVDPVAKQICKTVLRRIDETPILADYEFAGS